MLHIVTWKWQQDGFREHYSSAHVNNLANQIHENLSGMDYRIICITDNERDIAPEIVKAYPLWEHHNDLPNASGRHLPSCYRRLRLFSPEAQEELNIAPGDRIASIDLDMLVTGDLRPVFGRKERFVGWAVRGTHHITVFNGSLFMFTAGDLSEVWSGFDPAKSPMEAQRNGFLGSDQSWLSYKLVKLPGVGGWKFPEVVSYPRELRRRPFPKSVKVVSFHGRRKPWHRETQTEAPWIKPFLRG